MNIKYVYISKRMTVIKYITKSHISDVAKVEVDKIRMMIRNRAAETTEIQSMLLNYVIQDTSVVIQGKIPTKDVVHKMVQRLADRQSIIFPIAYTTYKSSPSQLEQFLLLDSGRRDNDRILFLGRESNTSSSNQMIHLYADGTFVLSLPLFAQIYILMAERGGFVLPVLYVLLLNKDSVT
ncbi:LOW QUALITY PROTEIN: hypothetical protein MXB_2175 [Myxobolus squamalis]|nr:LOW QUALITY PROTEIN: hypothetical protein MXB_2175 [Myxobolus squamalis]